MGEEEVPCYECNDVEREDCSNVEHCSIMVIDKCVKNTIVDLEFGVHGEMSSREVILKLVNEVKQLREELDKVKKYV